MAGSNIVSVDALHPSGLSWSGFNVAGDRKSIDEVERLIHSEAYLKQCDAILRERIERLEAQLRFNSARYSEGGAGEYINNSRYE